VTGYTGTVTFSSSDSAPVLPPDYTFTADDAGTHVFSAGVVLSDVNDMAAVTAADTLDPTLQGTLTLSVQ
jgi:adhesin/invasin